MYISVKEAAEKFNISKRRVQILCEQGRISGANMVSGVWLIPENALKPADGRRKHIDEKQMSFFDISQNALSIDDICKLLSISKATAKNWIRLGKLVPDIDGKLFSSEYIEKFIDELNSDDNTKLKSRRNKKSAAGKVLYKDYVQTEYNQKLVAELLELGVIENEKDLLVLLANFAVQLYYQSRGITYPDNYILSYFLSQEQTDVFHILIRDLIGNETIDSSVIKKLYSALTKKILFVKGEDTLGFVYISLRDIGRRKTSGIYYTPTRVVKEMIERLCENDANLKEKTICDPCCGTGNFLLSLGTKGINYSNLYGQDIDPISVHLARINIALTFPEISVPDLRSRITIGNTYFECFPQKFDVILGNPPWGSDFSEENAAKCRKLFKTATGKSLEAYDLLVEKALSMLCCNGVLAFVLPEAILSVAAHSAVRRLILDSCSFKFITYLGNVFSGVHCPSIILGITPDDNKTAVGCRVAIGNKRFLISQPRSFFDGTLSFNVSDEENECLNAISSIENAAYLKGNAKFALGIVTGNNKEYISDEKRDDNEVILKGSNILRYSKTNSGSYIRFVPESFQQVAPTEMYRAKEKLLYRFICETPVFTYDNEQTLSLNSCNIVIPEIDGLDIKYILAILNSSVAAYFISKKFNSIKLLRSHIEQMPIPVVTVNTQTAIIKKVDRIMCSAENIRGLYMDLDQDIMDLFNLSAKHRSVIKNALQGKNSFLTI
ncbi:MAG: N-6 DNA methylase [Oscillospiraceae bacterium]|nr:N-6 DNA methylase [Oscillospiraceae bacterium]